MSTSGPETTTGTPSEQQQQPVEHNGPLAKVYERAMTFFNPEVYTFLVAGGCAGAASRTVVSPLERLKIIQQVQPHSSSNQYNGVFRSLVRMWREEGFQGFMRGNGINCIRIVPYSAVQFTAYEMLKSIFLGGSPRTLDTYERLASGALAGITSVCTTYPLDLVRARLSIATASISMTAALPSLSATPASAAASTSSTPRPSLTSSYHTSSPLRAAATAAASQYTKRDLTVLGMTRKIMLEEGGIRALYRGMGTTALGVAPYVGINFAAYEGLREVITPPGKSGTVRKLACGALAGSISQTLTYPFDVLRRKMQVVGLKGGSVKYRGVGDALVTIVRTEGVRGLYRGLWPNLLKVAPSIATSFYVYELVKEYSLSLH